MESQNFITDAPHPIKLVYKFFNVGNAFAMQHKYEWSNDLDKFVNSVEHHNILPHTFYLEDEQERTLRGYKPYVSDNENIIQVNTTDDVNIFFTTYKDSLVVLRHSMLFATLLVHVYENFKIHGDIETQRLLIKPFLKNPKHKL